MKQVSLGKILITPQGEYDSHKTYQYFDVVSHDGASYMAKTNVPEGSSLTNTTYWLQIAAKGEPAPSEEVIPAVEAWLADNITQETGYILDDSLTVSGAAADAKKTGDELNDIKDANDYVIKTKFSDTFEAVPFYSSGGIVKGKINTTTGENESSTKHARRNNSIYSGNYVSLGTDDYEYTLFYYSNAADSWSDAYLHVYSDWITGSTWTLIDDSIGTRARIVIRHPDNSTISDADLDILTRVCVTRDLNQIIPQITTKKGNPVYIGEISALARDWYSHRNDIVGGSKAMVYGSNSILSTSSYTREIDGSTFVGMLLRGYSFLQTPYATGQGASPNSWTGNTAYNWAFNPFDYTNYSRADSLSRTKVRYASQMAEMMIERGQTVPIDKYYANIEPGDVLFFARHDSTTNDWYEPLSLKHISHVAICIAKEKATSADGWNTTTYPWKHLFAEAGHEDETTPDGVIKIRTLEQPQGDTSAMFENNINTLCLVCRPDFGSISDDYTDLSEKGTLPANTDLNTFTAIGLYRIPSGDSVLPTLVNYPSSNPGRLLVLSDKNGYYCTQVVITSTNTIFTRIQTSAANHIWTGWASYDYSTVRTRSGLKNSDNVYDANEFTQNGIYGFAGNELNTALNFPSPYTGELIVFNTSVQITQMYINRFGAVYYRVKYVNDNFTEWFRPLKPDTTLKIAGAAADAKAVGEAISNVRADTDNLFNSDTVLPEYFDKETNSIVGTADQLIGTILVADLPSGGLYGFEFDYMNTGGITSVAGPAVECDDENGNPLNIISMMDGVSRSNIPLSNFKKFMHRSFAYYVPDTAKSFKFVKYNNPSSTAIFMFKNIKITKLPKSEWFNYSNYYPNKSADDFIARNEATLAGYVHDGSILRMSETPESIPVNENHYGYIEFINATWDTLLPNGYTEGDYYNASTTKIHNVNVERVSRWMSTPYGENVDTYPIYRYMFTPQNGYNKTLFLTSGCHGNEAEGYWGLYRLIRMIYFEGYKYPTLRNLKDCRLIIVPSWNPWGMQHYRRYNAFSALNTDNTDVAKNYQAWEWLKASNHQVTVNGTVYDISQVGEANVIWETLQEYGDSINLWLDLHTDPYAGRNTTHVDIDDPRGNTPPYGCYGFSCDKTRGYARLCSVMDDFYNILRDEYSFNETWHLQATDPNGNSFTGWMAQFGFPSGVVEISTFMNGFPYASGSAGMMKLAQEYYGNCITEMLR